MSPLDRLVLNLERRDRVSAVERHVLEAAVDRIDAHPAHTDIIREGVPQTESRVLVEGFACRYKTLSDGRRQIMALHLAGDFIDLHSFTLKKLDHHIESITPVRVAVVPHERLREITETEPHLSRLLWLATMIDAAIHREWVVSAGRRPALAHLANLFCEMFIRSQIAQLAEGNRYSLPITQEDLADVCGLTPVHVNRVLQELRGTGVMEWRHGSVTVNDWPRLQGIAEFDPTYLNLERSPR